LEVNVVGSVDHARYERVVSEKLSPAAFPRSAGYEMSWVLENLMGPNVVWLAESLSGWRNHWAKTRRNVGFSRLVARRTGRG
jgi:hypothetical protein